MEATQLYETAIYDRESGHAFRSVTLPSRSLLGSETHDASVTAEELGFERTIRLEPVEVWSLPFLIDSVLRRQDGPYFQDGPFIEFMSWGVGRQQGRGPSTFAQHLVFSPVIPFEESSQEGKSLADIIVAAGGGTGAVVGFYASGDPLILLVVPAGIIVLGAATGIS